MVFPRKYVVRARCLQPAWVALPLGNPSKCCLRSSAVGFRQHLEGQAHPTGPNSHLLGSEKLDKAPIYSWPSRAQMPQKPMLPAARPVCSVPIIHTLPCPRVKGALLGLKSAQGPSSGPTVGDGQLRGPSTLVGQSSSDSSSGCLADVLN